MSTTRSPDGRRKGLSAAVLFVLVMSLLLAVSPAAHAAIDVTVTTNLYQRPDGLNRYHQSESFIGVVEGSERFDPAELADLGVKAYRMYLTFSRIEPVDDDGVFGSPTIAEIKADAASGYSNTIPWSVWDDQLTVQPTYAYHGSSNTITFEDIMIGLTTNGIEPVLTVKVKDSSGNPAWMPSNPVTPEEVNEWWENVFAIAYWVNVRNNYQVKYWEIMNEPNGSSYSGGMDEYAEDLDTAVDAIKTVNDSIGLPTFIMAPNNGDHDPEWIDGTLQRRDEKVDIVNYHEYSKDQDAYDTGHWDRVINNDTDGVIEPLWVGEWGSALGGYDDVTSAMHAVDGLYEHAISDLYGSTIFSMYPWAGCNRCPGLVEPDGTKNEGYFAMRLGIRALQGGKTLYEAQTADTSLNYLASKDADNLYVLVLNTTNQSQPKTVNIDVSAHVTSGTATIYEYSGSVKDAVIATPTLVNGQFSLASAKDNAHLAVIPLSGGGDTTPPAAPTGLTATTVGSSQIDLDWADNGEADLSGYNLYRDTTPGFTPGAGNRIASGLTASAHSDTGLAAATTYYYKVTAVDTSNNESAPSNEASATTDAGGDSTPPAAPTGLAATTVSSSQIDLDWADNSEADLSGYNLYRDTTPGFTPSAGNRIASGLATSAHSDTGLAAATTYYYKVTAVDTSNNESAPSNEASATTDAGIANLALNRPVTVSSVEPDNEGAKAVDGDLATKWRTKRKSNLAEEWITVDLGTSQAISQVVLEWAGNYATSYTIEVSDDNINWTTVFGTTTGDGGTDPVGFTTTNARYVKMNSTAWSHNDERNWLLEFEIYQ